MNGGETGRERNVAGTDSPFWRGASYLDLCYLISSCEI